MLKFLGRTIVFVGLMALTTACVSSRTVLPLSGEPDEVQTLLKEQGGPNDQRPGSVRTVDRFFRALEQNDGKLCWYLLDLRAAAAWQHRQSKSGNADAGPATIVQLIKQELTQKNSPKSLKRVKQNASRTAATVAVSWSDSDNMNVVVAMNQDGWRLLWAPKGSAIPEISADPQSSQNSTPIDFDEIHNQEESGRKQGGMGGGGMGRF